VLVVENDAGWAPSRSMLSRIRSLAKSRGLWADWTMVLALTDGSVLLCCESNPGYQNLDLVAVKTGSGWEIVTETEYLELG